MTRDSIIEIGPDNINHEHICCAFSDKKCEEGYAAKKAWLCAQHQKGYRFKRLDARGKVFIEYVPSEHSWIPLEADDCMVINCFWVSGQFKGKGHGKSLLDTCIADSSAMSGIAAVTGDKKRPFMSDPKFLLKQGFECVDSAPPFFRLWWKRLRPEAKAPRFPESAKKGRIEGSKGIEAFYSNTCPFTEHWTNEVLRNFADKNGIPCSIHRLSNREEALSMPVPWIINSVFLDGEFVTLELDSAKKIEKIMGLR